MKFVLSFLLVFLCVFSKAQVAPPMKVGGPQGIDVTRLLSREWLSIPIYVDTPANPLTGGGWPRAAYIIQATKNYRDATIEEWLKFSEAGSLSQLDSVRWQDGSGTVYFLPKGIDTSQALDYLLYGDTSVWHYTGRNWRRVGGNAEFYFDYLLSGGYVNQLSPISSRVFQITPSEYYLGGVKYSYDTAFRIQAPSKSADSTGRIDVIYLSTIGPRLRKGIASRLPVKPQVRSGEIELASIYFRPFDTIPNVMGGRGAGVSSIYRIPGKDSIYYIVDTLTFSIKDSIGISKNDTLAMLTPYKFTAANGLTKDSAVFRLGGTLNQNTNISLNTRRLTFIGGSDTTRIFSNGRLSIGGSPDSTYMLNVNGDIKVNSGRIYFGENANTNTALIINPTPGGGGVSQGVVIGNNTSTLGNGSYLFGARNYATGTSINLNMLGNQNDIDSSNLCTVIGNSNNIPNPSSYQLIFGYNNTSNSYTNNQNASIVLGMYNNTNGYWGSGLIGSSLKYYEDGQLAFGGNSNNVNFATKNVYFGNGVKNENNNANANFGHGPDIAINPSWANNVDSTNRNGGSLTIAGGRGTGTGTPGAIKFSIWNTTTTGSTLHLTLTERARINQNGNLLVGTTVDNGYRVSAVGGTTMNGLYGRGYIPIRADYVNDGNTIFGAGTTGDTCSVVIKGGSISQDYRILRIFGVRQGEEVRVNGTSGINTLQDTTAFFEITSTNAGFLQPRMTNVQRDSISSRPSTGLQVFSTTDSANYVYRGTGGGWQKIANEISGSASLNFPSTSNGDHSDLTFTVTGAEEGDVVALGTPNAAIQAHSCYTAWVSAANTVTVRFNNYGSGSHDPAQATFKIKVFK